MEVCKYNSHLQKKVQGQMLVITDWSVLHVLCKIMESIIQDYIMSHFHNNNFFSQKQFRFIKGRSTTIQLLHIMDILTECLEQDGQMDVIYTDLEKAFNKIPHKRLISILSSYRLNKELIELITAVLINRKE